MKSFKKPSFAFSKNYGSKIQTRRITTNPTNIHKYPEAVTTKKPELEFQRPSFQQPQSFRDILQDISVAHILETKPNNWKGVFMIDSEAPCVEAIRLMAYKNVGSVVVAGHSTKQPVGIFTERDYLTKLIVKGKASPSTKIEDVMTCDPLVISPGYNLETVAAIMGSCSVRHLPVSSDSEMDAIDGDEGSLIGMVSARDVCWHMVKAAEEASDIDLLRNTVSDVFEKMGRKTSEQCYVNEDDTVMKALEIMTEHNTGGVFVTSGQNLSGIFTERDYLQNMFLKGRASKDTRVGDVMKRDVISVDPRVSLHECLDTMAQKSIRTLPLISLTGQQINDAEKEHILGMITFLDVIRFLGLAEKTGLHDAEDLRTLGNDQD